MNRVIACLEYVISDMKLIMCISIGHNAIWTSWAFLQIPTWLWAWPTLYGFGSILEGYVDHTKPKFWLKREFLYQESTCLKGCRFALDTLYNLLETRWLKNFFCIDIFIQFPSNIDFREFLWAVTKKSCSWNIYSWSSYIPLILQLSSQLLNSL